MTSRSKDWTGMKWNKLTLLNRTNKVSGHKRLWSALCECGKVVDVVPYHVKTGNTKTCGQCSKPPQCKDWSGVKYFHLLFVKPSKKNKNQQVIWEAMCDCGKIIYTIPSNKAKSCGCFSNKEAAKRCAKLGKSGRKFQPDISSARHIWRAYKSDGDLPFDVFLELSRKPCHYCNRPPMNKYNHKDGGGRIHPDGTFIYSGLDRIDPTKGHDANNVVPCCIDCNMAKSDKTQQEFLEHVDRMYNHYVLATKVGVFNSSVQFVPQFEGTRRDE